MTLRSSTTGKLSDRTRRRAAWTVPLVVAAGVAVGATVMTGSASGASPNLPTRTAAQLLAAVQTSDVSAFSGEIQETASLGIPSLPGSGSSSASLSWESFVSGTHTARVWVDGAQKQRVALIGQLSEADVVHNGTNLWTYTSDTNTVTHTTLSAHDSANKPATTPVTPAKPDARDITPAASAARILSAISPSTKVTVDSTQTVAGRPAYTLELAPKVADSTVSKVTIAMDATTHIPLQVQVYAGGSTPAFQTGFSKISFATPAASTFDFTAPAGSTTSSNPLTPSRHGNRHPGTARPAGAPARPASSDAKPSVIGSGWTAVVEIPAGASASITRSLPSELTSSVGSTGERLLHTALVNAVLLPDGRAFVGAVTPSYLEHVAATH